MAACCAGSPGLSAVVQAGHVRHAPFALPLLHPTHGAPTLRRTHARESNDHRPDDRMETHTRTYLRTYHRQTQLLSNTTSFSPPLTVPARLWTLPAPSLRSPASPSDPRLFVTVSAISAGFPQRPHTAMSAIRSRKGCEQAKPFESHHAITDRTLFEHERAAALKNGIHYGEPEDTKVSTSISAFY